MNPNVTAAPPQLHEKQSLNMRAEKELIETSQWKRNEIASLGLDSSTIVHITLTDFADTTEWLIV